MNKLEEFHYIIRIYLACGDVFTTLPLNMPLAIDYMSAYRRHVENETVIEFKDLDENNSFGHANRIMVAYKNISYVALENINGYKDVDET